MHPSFSKLTALALLLAPLGVAAAGVPRTKNAPSFEALLQRPLSLVDALNIATEQNGIILQARKSVEARLGVAIQTRAILLPQVLGRVDYSVTQDSLVELNTGFNATGPTLNNQRWVGDARVVQSLYQGGRLLSALRVSKLIREQAMQDFLTSLGQVLLQVRTAYDDVQLAAAQIEVRQASVDLLKGELDNVRSRLAAGVVSEFDQLRAEVELSNAEPPLILARNSYVIAKQALVELLGYNVLKEAKNDLPLRLDTPLQVRKYPADLPGALAAGWKNRTELESLNTQVKLSDENIITARAGNKPGVQAFAGYDVTSRMRTRNAGDSLDGAIAGVQMSWPLFDGFLTQGRVAEAQANRGLRQAQLEEQRRLVSLQVRTAWSDILSAKATVDSQKENIGRAERTVQLARERYLAGTGIQVDILSAQTALTQTRGNYVQALRDYSVAYSRLLRATGEDVQRRQGQ